MELHTLSDAHGYTEPVADPEEIADEDPATAYERASAAASEPLKAEPVPPEESAPKFTSALLMQLIERVYVQSVRFSARRNGVPLSPEIDELGKLEEIERQILELTAPSALAQLDQVEAFLARYGHLVFAGTVFVGTYMRSRAVKDIAAAMRAEQENAAKPA